MRWGSGVPPTVLRSGWRGPADVLRSRAGCAASGLGRPGRPGRRWSRRRRVARTYPTSSAHSTGGGTTNERFERARVVADEPAACAVEERRQLRQGQPRAVDRLRGEHAVLHAAHECFDGAVVRVEALRHVDVPAAERRTRSSASRSPSATSTTETMNGSNTVTSTTVRPSGSRVANCAKGLPERDTVRSYGRAGARAAVDGAEDVGSPGHSRRRLLTRRARGAKPRERAPGYSNISTGPGSEAPRREPRLLEHLGEGRVRVPVEPVGRRRRGPVGRAVVRPAGDHVDVEVLDALAGVRPGGLQQHRAVAPRAPRIARATRCASAVVAARATGPALSRSRVCSTGTTRVCPGASDESGRGSEGDGVLLALDPDGGCGPIDDATERARVHQPVCTSPTLPVVTIARSAPLTPSRPDRPGVPDRRRLPLARADRERGRGRRGARRRAVRRPGRAHRRAAGRVGRRPRRRVCGRALPRTPRSSRRSSWRRRTAGRGWVQHCCARSRQRAENGRRSAPPRHPRRVGGGVRSLRALGLRTGRALQRRPVRRPVVPQGAGAVTHDRTGGTWRARHVPPVRSCRRVRCGP